MNKLRNRSGITLIAIAVTLIVILIIASITISALTGQEGTIDKATTIKSDAEIAEEMDALRLAIQETMNSDRKGEIETTNLANHLKQHIGEDKISDPEYREDSNSHVVKFTDKYEEDDLDSYYTITEDGEIIKGIVDLPVLKLNQYTLILEYDNRNTEIQKLIN